VKTGASLFATGPAADAFRDCGSGLEDSRLITFFMFSIFRIHGLLSLKGAGGVTRDYNIFFRPFDTIEEKKDPRWPELNYNPSQ
jgi:hypothetical protein